jgi:hypothetical protein
MSLLAAIDPLVMDYFSHWLDYSNPDRITFIGTAGMIEPNMARQHFLFHTATDALCFCHFYSHWIQKPGNNVFTALGQKPNSNQIQTLKKRFPNARFVGVFDDDLFGRVLDCKTTLWLMDRDASFILAESEVAVKYKGNIFRISAEQFSLHRFRLITGTRSNYRTIKPKGAVSFTTMLAVCINDH